MSIVNAASRVEPVLSCAILLRQNRRAAGLADTRLQTPKSFLLLFFKKAGLAFTAPPRPG
jgi:hypothetical protein